MIFHALKIIQTELGIHLDTVYNPANGEGKVLLANLSEGLAGAGNGAVERERIVLSIVNLKEEKALKNVPNYVKNNVTLTTTYENPPVFLNFLVLLTTTHSNYEKALLYLSRAIRFFQFKNVFTQDTVLPASLATVDPVNPLDRLETFKLILDIYSPSMEEANHLWGTLGGKQYPFALYVMRMLDLKFPAIQSESGLSTEVVNDFYHKNPVGN
jgi:Pvc16 N-terminal domain